VLGGREGEERRGARMGLELCPNQSLGVLVCGNFFFSFSFFGSPRCPFVFLPASERSTGIIGWDYSIAIFCLLACLGGRGGLG